MSAAAFSSAVRAPAQPAADAGTTLRTYCIHLLTPMLGGGVQAGKTEADHPIRGKGLKWQLCFWWSLLAEAGQLPGQAKAWPHDSAELARERRSRFGGTDAKGRPVPAMLRIRVHGARAEPATWDAVPNYVHGLLGSQAKPKPYAQATPEAAATLELRWKGPAGKAQHVFAELDLALRFFSSFGSVGSRGRRGMGALMILDGNGLPLAAVEAELAGSAGLDLASRAIYGDVWKSWKWGMEVYRLFRQGADARRVSSIFSQWGNALVHHSWESGRRGGDFPVFGLNEPQRSQFVESLSREYTNRDRRGERIRHSKGLLQQGLAVRSAGTVVAPRPNRPQWGYRPGRSNWPNAKTVRKAALDYARGSCLWSGAPPTRESQHPSGLHLPTAAFGLPIVGHQLAPVHGDGRNIGGFRLEAADSGDGRLPSPLIIRPRFADTDEMGQPCFEVVAVLLPKRYRDQALNAEVRVIWSPAENRFSGQGRLTDVDLGKFPVWLGPGSASRIGPMQQLAPSATDPLSAFMQFFRDCSPA